MTYTSPSTLNMSQGFPVLLEYINDVTGSWISNMILIAIWIIVLAGYYKAKNDFGGALAIAGFGTFVVGLFFWLGGFISGITFSIVIAFLLLGVIVLLIDTKNN